MSLESADRRLGPAFRPEKPRSRTQLVEGLGLAQEQLDRGGAASLGGEPASGPACLPGESYRHPNDISCEGKSRPGSRLAGRTAGPTLCRKCAVILAQALRDAAPGVTYARPSRAGAG